MRGFVSPDVMVRRPSEHDAWPDAGGLQALIGRGSVSLVTSFVVGPSVGPPAEYNNRMTAEE